MGDFLYWLPGRTMSQWSAAAEQVLRESGLADRLGSRRLGKGAGEVLSGPDGGRGLIVARTSVQPRYQADQQRWEQVGTQWLCGVEEIGPAQLQREAILHGHDVTLSDGRVWHVPVVRDCAGQTRLPVSMRKDASDVLVGDIVPRCMDLWQMALKVWDAFVMDESLAFTDLWPFCCAVLGMQYAVAEPEVSWLRILDTDVIMNVARAAIDLPGFAAMGEAAEKKSPSGG